jgi:hypothetical protein
MAEYALDHLNRLRDDLGDRDGRFYPTTPDLTLLLDEVGGDYWAAVRLGRYRMAADAANDTKFVHGRDPSERTEKVKTLIALADAAGRMRPAPVITSTPDDRTLVRGGITYRTSEEGQL